GRPGPRPGRGAVAGWPRRAAAQRIPEGGDPGERLSLQELERGPAAGGDVRELVLEPGHRRRRIAAADDRGRSALPRLDHGLGDRTRTLVERGSLAHTHSTVPETCFRVTDA